MSIFSLKDLSLRDEKKTLLNRVSLELNEGESLGIIGESGSGKTMTIKSLLGILPKDVEMEAEEIEIGGVSLKGLSDREKRRLLGEKVGFVPQNTVNYLHPLIQIHEQMTDGYVSYHGRKSRQEALEKARKLLLEVGLTDPERVLRSYPGELSGGMRQRVNIAMALMMDPVLLVADEPTSALDRIVQVQVAELYRKLKRERSISLLIVSHDLSLISSLSDRVAVLYAGCVVEEGKTDEVFSCPMHPYTHDLFALTPGMDTDKSKPLSEIPGSVPEKGRESRACLYAPRCRYATEGCWKTVELTDRGNGHRARCLIREEAQEC